MEPEPAASARRVPEKAWTASGKDEDGTLEQWAEPGRVPGLASGRKDARPRRHVGLRFLKPRGELFEDGHDRKRFAVVTNRTGDGAKVPERHREKAGSVEHVHDELKNEPAAGRMPGRKSGANAAWFALDAPACNVAAALRAAEPEPEARVARARAVRCHLLLPGARLSRFSRRITLRFAASKERIARVLRVLAAFPCRVQPTGQAVPGANRGERRRTGSARPRRSVPGSGPPVASESPRTFRRNPGDKTRPRGRPLPLAPQLSRFRVFTEPRGGAMTRLGFVSMRLRATDGTVPRPVFATFGKMREAGG